MINYATLLQNNIRCLSKTNINLRHNINSILNYTRFSKSYYINKIKKKSSVFNEYSDEFNNKIIKNPNIPINYSEKDIYNQLQKQNMLPEMKLKEMIDNSKEYTELEFKNEVLNSFLHTNNIKNMLNSSLVEISKMCCKNEYFANKFEDFWELLADEIDIRIDSSFTNKQIIDITRSFGRVNFYTKPDFMKLMEDTILDSNIKFHPKEYYELISIYLDNSNNLNNNINVKSIENNKTKQLDNSRKLEIGSAPFFNYCCKAILNNKELFGFNEILVLVKKINNHRYTVGGNFGLNKILEDNIIHNDLNFSTRGKELVNYNNKKDYKSSISSYKEVLNIDYEDLMYIAGTIFKNNLFDNKAKLSLENILYKYISNLSLTFDIDNNNRLNLFKLVKLIEDSYKFNFFQNIELLKLLIVCIEKVIDNYIEFNNKTIEFSDVSNTMFKQSHVKNMLKSNNLSNDTIKVILYEYVKIINILPKFVNLIFCQSKIDVNLLASGKENIFNQKINKIAVLALINLKEYNNFNKICLIKNIKNNIDYLSHINLNIGITKEDDLVISEGKIFNYVDKYNIIKNTKLLLN